MRVINYRNFSLRLHKNNWQKGKPNVCQFELTFGFGLHCKHCYSDCYNKARDKKTRCIFITYQPDIGSEDGLLLKKGNYYIYKCPLETRPQLMLINETFDKVKAYLLPKKDKGWVWSITDIIYDFLQVLLINYFALNKNGIFIHGIGLRDMNGKGLLFAGKSGAGKSTTARLWHKHSKVMVLNDDRIIVRKLKNSFFIYGSPWHGDFNDYLLSRIESAPLDKLFLFIILLIILQEL